MVWNKRKYLSGLDDAAVLQLYKQKQWPRCIDELFLRYGHLIYGVFLKYTKDKYAAEDLLKNEVHAFSRESKMNKCLITRVYI